MIVTCSCGAKLKIGDDKLTDAGVRIKCPKCGTLHVARKPAPAGAELSAAPAMPWFASQPAEPAAPPAPERPATPAAKQVPEKAAAPQPAPSMPWFASQPSEQAAPAASERPAPAAAPVPAPAPPPVSTAAPAMPWFAASAGAPQASPAAASAAALVLVAHDSKVVVDMIRGVVSEAGLAVEHAPDGLDALKKASALKPQVMIVDVGLTGIYGFELCERLKGDPETRGIKIILLSSVYGLTAYKRNPVTLYGADDYIEKHHIPDRLVPKIKELLAGRPSGEQAAAAPSPPPAPAAPVRQEPAPLPSPPAAAAPAAGARIQKPAVMDEPDVLPKVPVTLDGTRRLTPPPGSHVGAGPAPAVSAPAPPAPPAKPAPTRPAAQDESIKLDAAFFEQDEYEAPAKVPAKVEADPVEVEKARRFARIVVSDIVLYNQEAVAEGIAKGTFYELLKDDISEGRALYDKRVPEAIRASKDYFQEAFDNFIATKKKQR